MLNRPVVIVSDLHLGPTCPEGAAAAATLVIRRHPGHEILLMGDTFDLSIDPPGHDPAQSVVRHLANHPELCAALRAQLAIGSPVTLISGNHDAQLAVPRVRRALLTHMDLADSAPLACGLWCARRAAIHFEHGHNYDPDNAPSHPLVPPSADTEPLGVVLMRRVLAPRNGLIFAHAHELTPWAGLTQAFARLGFDAPRLVARYYFETIRIVLRARRKTFEKELALGQECLREYARSSEILAEELEQLLGCRAIPRHHDWRDAFFRLYLDRSLATAMGWTTAAAGALIWNPALWITSGLCLSYLVASLARGKNRYGGTLVTRLREAALAVRKLLNLRAVVLGHTHVPDECPGYVNNGSFAFGTSNGRSYLLLDSSGTLLRVGAQEQAETQKLDVCVTDSRLGLDKVA